MLTKIGLALVLALGITADPDVFAQLVSRVLRPRRLDLHTSEAHVDQIHGALTLARIHACALTELG